VSIDARTAGIGRRNCKRCTRWKHNVEFRWRWRTRLVAGRRRRSSVPTIDVICFACRREEERERYANKTAEEKREIGKRANKNTRDRRQKERELQESLRNTVKVLAGTQKKLRGDTLLPLMPFRLWLLSHLKEYGGLAGLAKRARLSEDTIMPYLEGIWWESDCRPHPLDGVRLGFVDSFFTRLEIPDQMVVIYPLMDELDAETYRDE
jgi:hypothetical protein